MRYFLTPKLKPMKTRTVEVEPKPTFAEWWCHIRGIEPTEALRRKLDTFYMCRSRGVSIYLFAKKNNISNN